MTKKAPDLSDKEKTALNRRLESTAAGINEKLREQTGVGFGPEELSIIVHEMAKKIVPLLEGPPSIPVEVLRVMSDQVLRSISLILESKSPEMISEISTEIIHQKVSNRFRLEYERLIKRANEPEESVIGPHNFDIPLLLKIKEKNKIDVYRVVSTLLETKISNDKELLAWYKGLMKYTSTKGYLSEREMIKESGKPLPERCGRATINLIGEYLMAKKILKDRDFQEVKIIKRPKRTY